MYYGRLLREINGNQLLSLFSLLSYDAKTYKAYKIVSKILTNCIIKNWSSLLHHLKCYQIKQCTLHTWLPKLRAYFKDKTMDKNKN